MKKNTFYILCLIGFGILFSTGCKQDELIEVEPPIIVPNEAPEEYYDTNMRGIILDTDGQPLSDVTIQSGGKTTTSDAYGFFNLSGLSAPNTGLYIKAEKEGYFVGGTHYFPAEVKTSSTTITMIDKEIQQFEATQGITTLLNGGAGLSIPASSISLNGTPYSGEVNIAATWLDPNASATPNTMPGALLGINDDGRMQVLQSYGMIAVEMLDPQGQPLQLSDDAVATLTFPLEGQTAENAEDQIILWHFDEESGQWVEEGKANREGNTYIAEVSHFSWWNCDVPFNLTRLCLNVQDQNGNEVNNYKICLSDGNFNLCDPLGSSCGFVPEDVTLTIELYDICNEIFHTENIGPFSGGVNQTTPLDINVILEDHALLSFSGAVRDCADNNITDALVTLQADDHTYYDTDLDDNGYEINYINCSASDNEVTLTAIDLIAFEEGIQTVNVMTGQYDYTQDMSACGTPIAELMTIKNDNEEFVVTKCLAYQTAAETLIIAQDSLISSSYVMLGFKGFGEGTFTGNIISDVQQGTGSSIGIADSASFTISNYGSIGGQIIGTYIENGITGQFVATRMR